ncbi:Uncharacterised protein [Mycobacteroides abscessus subsp. massiliense]|uniref:hypothetical protein n=1 Tax=Mycobacteroides abscessus TaxID=36809 RepID=UPI0009A8CBD4|nr:hypothetical protein [Mycobacteroides abscessus]SLE60986.1 Uncharacterised protein [Mycobacteroides abscessus subsp. massiliense]
MSRRRAAEQTAREERASAIRRCRRCDPCGWQLDLDHTPIEPAVRCDHGAPAAPPAVRDITEPIHQPDDTED